MPATTPIAGSKRGGSALIEFSLLGIPLIFVILSVMAASLNMWQLHSLAYSVDTTARYVVAHGNVCTQTGNTCTVTLGNIATLMQQQSGALDASLYYVTFTSSSGSIACNPLNTCTSNATTWPPNADNAIGNDITVKGYYTLVNPIMIFWPDGNKIAAARFTVSATARERIVF